MMGFVGVQTGRKRCRRLMNLDVEHQPETLRHMGQAINALSPNVQEGGDSMAARKENFDEHSTAAYAGIQAFQAKMRRQAYALEEAGIIAPEALNLSATNTQQQGKGGLAGSRGSAALPVVAAEPDRITNGGLGHLDVGWLNSRGNKVGVEKEAELLHEAKVLLQAEAERKRTAGAVG
ncbi:hypothetical protein B0A54_01871 [Friedmanniomyces endolithicus]|uniref:Mediator of RNA polymerase II transcription subunit 11 n=1 Tax=Friedmanniomyces endolithicus TaxID=329885 RepID=A0A4V5N9G3_9PEZI|nr:hypothetical protein B0A54_01871 [Friedmanniomyces endolithicus]